MGDARMEAAVKALRVRVVKHMVDAAARPVGQDGGDGVPQQAGRKSAKFLQLSVWTVCCLSAWQRTHPEEEALPIDHHHRVTRNKLRSFYQRCITVALYSYHSDTDSFEPAFSDPPRRGSTLPVPNVTPGSGVLWYVARSGGRYRTRNIHLDVRSQLSSDDIRRGLWDAVYTCVDAAPVTYIVVLSAPASGLLDAVADQFPAWVRELVHAPSRTAAKHSPSEWALELQREVLTAPLLQALVSPDTLSDSVGVMIASIRKGKSHDEKTNHWEWQLATAENGLPPPDYAPMRIARAVIKRAMLGSLSSAWRSKIPGQLDEWRDHDPLPEGETLASDVPGVAGYETDLYRTPVWISPTDSKGAAAVLRISYSGRIAPAQQRQLEIARKFCRRIGTIVEEWTRCLRGTLARTRLRWDLSEALLQLVADHLAGRNGTSEEFTEFGRSADLLQDLLAEVELTGGRSIEAAFRDARELIVDSRGCLGAAVTIVPWLFRLGYRIADAHSFRTSPSSGEPRLPLPAVFVVDGAIARGRARLAGQMSESGEETGSQLEAVVTSRSYLIPLQKLLSALRESRPGVTRLTWRDDTTVDLWDEHGREETLTLDLVLRDGTRFRTLELVSDGDMLFSVHHDDERPLYTMCPADIQKEAERMRESLRKRDQPFGGLKTTLRAIVVVWEPVDDGFPVAVALTDGGKPLRKHLQDTYRYRNRDIATRECVPPESWFSCDAAQKILRHGWYREGFLTTWKDLQSARNKKPTNRKRWAAWASQNARARSDDLPFAGAYLHGQFAPHNGRDGFGGFPEGLAPLARQIHVIPLKVGDDRYLLHLYTDWEASPAGQDKLRESLLQRVYEVVKRLNATENKGPASPVITTMNHEFTQVIRHHDGKWHVEWRASLPRIKAPQTDFVLHCDRAGKAGLLWQAGRDKGQKLGRVCTQMLIEAALKPGGVDLFEHCDKRSFLNLKDKFDDENKWTPKKVLSETNHRQVVASTYNGSFEIVLPTSWYHQLRPPPKVNPATRGR